MNRNYIKDKITKILADNGILLDEMGNFIDTQEIPSLRYISCICEIEYEFDINFSNEMISNNILSNIEAMIDYIALSSE